MVRAVEQATREEQLFLIGGVDWKFYENLLDQLGDRHVFVTYDRGRLQLMSPSWEHARRSDLLARMVGIAYEEAQIRFIAGGSTTFRKKESDAGLEPDRCFFIQNVQGVIGKRTLSLKKDPPPDLAIEVEVSERQLDRIGVYGRLAVPEIWRHDGTTTHVLLLGRAGRYRPARRSVALPWLPLLQVDRLLEQSWSSDDLAWSDSARAFVRGILDRNQR